MPKSPPTWVVWIEIQLLRESLYLNLSHHPHGWCGLKYFPANNISVFNTVTTHMGGVDWNPILNIYMPYVIVTTHMGGVDWNNIYANSRKYWRWSPPTWVVWIEISAGWGAVAVMGGSPPTWVVWIEIFKRHIEHRIIKSPPTWVVWIEILAIKLQRGTVGSPPTWVVWIEIVS